MKSNLAERECQACDSGTPRLQGGALRDLKDQLDGDWKILDEKKLEKQFKFEDFHQALEFANKVGALAEEQGHHPDIYLTYGEVRIQIWTHKIGGLAESDFILAAKISELK